ncbi:MAG: hypothetical protein H6907_02450 [Hyphomicrobiales bacterium]|nr:hypothetical protein [Hyphomicrobiales bacterium]
MSRFADYFLGDHQLLVLGTVAVVWLGLAALGGLVGGRRRLRELDPLLGWALVSAVFTAGGTLTGVPFRYLALVLAAAAVAGAVAALRRDRALVPAAALRTAVLALPLLALTSAMAASQWDEFSHWLPTARYLLLADGFPDAAAPKTGASYPAYPYAWPFLSYLVGRVAGTFVENAGAVLNVLLLLTFGLVSVRLILMGLEDARPTHKAGWGLCALGALSVTLLNPTFAQKVALTAYADVATAVTLGAAGVLGWLMLQAEAEGDGDTAMGRAVQAGLILSVLVVLKQATFVLFVILAGALVLAGLRDPAVRLGRLARLMVGICLPPLLVYGLWRYYVVTELPGKEFVIRPLDGWLIHLIPRILLMMAIVLAKKGVYLGLMVLATAFGILGLVRFRGAFDRLAIIVGASFLGYNAFLLWTYVAAFGEFDALRVASLWRYNMHLGMLAVAFGAYGGAVLWRRRLAARVPARRLAWLPMVAILAAPVALAHKLRFDLAPPSPHYRAVAAEVAQAVAPGSRVFVFDPAGNGEAGLITRYHLGGRAAMVGYLSAFQETNAANLNRLLAARAPTHVLVHSQAPGAGPLLGLDLPRGRSYLLAAGPGGTWTVVRSWDRAGANQGAR